MLAELRWLLWQSAEYSFYFASFDWWTERCAKRMQEKISINRVSGAVICLFYLFELVVGITSFGRISQYAKNVWENRYIVVFASERREY